MDVQKVVVSAPGKAILHGEHAVVYERKAIACALNGFIIVTLSTGCPHGQLSISASDISKTKLCINIQKLAALKTKCLKHGSMTQKYEEWQNEIKSFVETEMDVKNKIHLLAVSSCISCYFKTLAKDCYPSVELSVIGQNLPYGAGLGSSSAFNVALATAFLVASKQICPVGDAGELTLDKCSLSLVNELAYSLEQIIHGNPSGVDNSVSTYGGAVSFEKGTINHLTRFLNLKVLVVDSGVTRNTKAMVSNVKGRMERHPQAVEHIMSSIHEISNEAEQLLQGCDSGKAPPSVYEKLKELIDTNHHLLNAVGVGHPKLDEIHRIAKQHSFSCKLTGAGGGGCALVLLNGADEKEVNALKQELEKQSFRFWEVTLGCPGVKVKSINNEFNPAVRCQDDITANGVDLGTS